jgi:hypothetical protein
MRVRGRFGIWANEGHRKQDRNEQSHLMRARQPSFSLTGSASSFEIGAYRDLGCQKTREKAKQKSDFITDECGAKLGRMAAKHWTQKEPRGGYHVERGCAVEYLASSVEQTTTLRW